MFSGPEGGGSDTVSPKRERKLFFFGLTWSSFRPTSSKTSSCVDCGFSNVLPLTADRGKRADRESSEARVGNPSCWLTGDLAEIS